MGTTFTATTKAADAPDIEAGVYDAIYDGIAKKFITGGIYGDSDNYEWSFTILDDDGDVMYDAGEPIVLTGLSSLSTNIASKTVPKTVRYLKALMTPAEFATFEAGEGAELETGRKCQVEVAIKDSGWPSIVNVLPARKARRSRTTAVTADAE